MGLFVICTLMEKGELGVGPTMDELKIVGSYTVRNFWKRLFFSEYCEDN
jgi:hypothetical protein